MTNTFQSLPLQNLATGQIQELENALAHLALVWGRVQPDLGVPLSLMDDVRALRAVLYDHLALSDALDYGSMDADFAPVFSPDDAPTQAYATHIDPMDATQPIVVPNDLAERLQRCATIRAFIQEGRYLDADVAIAVLLGYEVTVEHGVHMMRGATTQPLPQYTTRYTSATLLCNYVPVVKPVLPTPLGVVEAFLTAWETRD